jgi:hypothetical protein
MGVSRQLAGESATLEISDPWDFVTMHGAGPFPAVVLASGSGAILLRLNSPLRFAGVDYGHLVATARHAAPNLESAAHSVAVPVNLVPVEASGSIAEWRKSAADWRGKHLVGTLRL